jgi:hypothetical protein
MMSGGIQAFDMIKRHKDNESLRKNINYFKTKGTYTRTAKSINIDYRTATKEQRAEIRKRIIEERKTERRKSTLTLILSLLATGILIFLMLKFVLP